MERVDVAALKAGLRDRVEALCRELMPDGTRQGHYWIARNPSRDDKQPGSFWIWLKGAPGAWKDAATGQQGDVLDLVALARGEQDFARTLEWAQGWLHGSWRSEAQAPRPATPQPQDDEAELDRRRRQAHAVWLSGAPRLTGTLAETYLASRGIALCALTRQPGAMRFHRRLEHRPSGTGWPAILTIMIDAAYRPAGVHRTYLAADGSGKAGVEPQRMMLGVAKGAVMKLWRGASGLSDREASTHGIADTLVLTEGIEDALSVALAAPHMRVWAAGSLGNLAHVVLPACATDVIIAADNDWGKPECQKLLMHSARTLQQQGASVRIAHSPIGKDFNDALRGRPLA